MHTLATSFVLGYHGCDALVAEALLSGSDFRKSTNEYDWLGHGIYFWEANPMRGLEFARELAKSPRRHAKISKPTVIGAAIELGLCLDLTTSAGIREVGIAHKRLEEIASRAKVPLPTNSKNKLRRNLDCAVIQLVHKIRSDEGQPPIDTVKGVFVEDDPIYPTSGFNKKTHIQICVCNPDCIKGVFRVPDRHLKALRAR